MAPEGWSAWAAWFGLFGGTLSGFGAWKAYSLAKRHDELLRGDEVVVAGRLQKPGLLDLDHNKCVLWTHLVNRSPRKVVIDGLRVFGPDGDVIEVTWAGEIDDVGNPKGASGVLAVEAKTEFYCRRNDGESFLEGTVFKLSHGFQGSPLILRYVGEDGWDQWATT